MDDTGNEIRRLASEIFPRVVQIRRHLHRNPELSMQEFETSRFITSVLGEFGIPYTEGIAGTGIVGMIGEGRPGDAVIALRADMDALPIFEKNEVEYRSVNAGIMHACGHDAHMASVLGTAAILSRMRDRLKGTIKLIFQPSEEMYPGGALLMIRAGVLENPSPTSIFGQHVLPTLDAGKVGMRAGKYMASTDEVFLTVRGKGGHAATPELVTDPVLIASHLVVALQQLVSRHASPLTPTVLSFGRFTALGKTNIIPDEAHLSGIIRTFDENWREELKNKIRKMATELAASMGATCEVKIDKGYPFLVNEKELTQRAFNWAGEFLGKDNVVELEPRMTSEDFAYFAQQRPSCFYRLGIRNIKRGIVSNLHTDTFDIDESSLETGMSLMAWLSMRELEFRAGII